MNNQRLSLTILILLCLVSFVTFYWKYEYYYTKFWNNNRTNNNARISNLITSDNNYINETIQNTDALDISEDSSGDSNADTTTSTTNTTSNIPLNIKYVPPPDFSKGIKTIIQLNKIENN